MHTLNELCKLVTYFPAHKVREEKKSEWSFLGVLGTHLHNCSNVSVCTYVCTRRLCVCYFSWWHHHKGSGGHSSGSFLLALCCFALNELSFQPPVHTSERLSLSSAVSTANWGEGAQSSPAGIYTTPLTSLPGVTISG